MKALTLSLMAAGLSLTTALVAPHSASAADKPTLTVYTYDSFNTDWGPGPAIKKGFEANCSCTVEFVAPGDATETFNRLRLEGKNSKADILVGLDSNLIADADKSGLFQAHAIKTDALTLPIDWDSSTYVPFDWGHFAFVYDSDKVKNPPTSFDALLNAPDDLKILIQDPRSSTPGLGLLLWVKDVYGDKAADVWEKLAPRIVTVTKGWSEAYGMFLEDQAQMVLSYTTSPAYHIAAEEKTNYKAAEFSDGHYMQLELAAITKSSKHKELANQFLSYLVGPEAQKIIPTTNWMYPVALPFSELPEAFKGLVKPEQTRLIAPDEVPATRKEALNEWLAALSK
ncbi:thiamine ABC transporter substrate binding subunit [Cohaesibacter celericrescens]|uniref:Thiamine-binding periplasmic protein n=1 Tax=Cohaesibacter celericrescens TaxID=2067669 RepID=A0A2N5XW17_9HYPH|nr:thiamine ABC transporter substrate binding subunit [Cohaesibacter celericrescens]PLW78690.1 thiamine ABC transporter substrate binding subunit [Cohaesibacter celericrescens]